MRTGKPVDANIMSRVINGVRGFVRGIAGETWFSPGQPLQPQEQQAVRRFEYAPGANIVIPPRAYEPISFQQLRDLANNYDIVRLAIETRKDQLSALDFQIQPIDQKAGESSKAKMIKDKLRYPDNQHSWSTWLRMLLEDLLVIDAPCIEPRFTNGGELWGLDVLDGSTIKLIIDERGRTPTGANPAYQQVLYGIPAANFTFDELVYMPRNLRSNKLYGYSPVEQIIMTLNIAIRRQLSQLQYYTDGNIPDALLSCPKEWDPTNIAEFQKYWDALLAGDTQLRRRMKFVPGEMKIQFTRNPELKDDYDEWLARVVCFAFSLPPTPFIKQMNRSTAEAAQETALQEGLTPFKQWVKELMDYIIWKYFQAPELEFVWQAGEVEQDPLTQAQINDIYIKNGTYTPQVVQEQLGVEVTDPALNPLNNAATGGDGEQEELDE